MSERHKSIYTRIKDLDYAVTYDYLIKSQLTDLLSGGLQVVTLCNDGSDRSFDVARDLTNDFGVPAISVLKGLSHLRNDKETAQCFPFFVQVMSSVPFPVVILTKLEVFMFCSQINQFKKYLYSSSAKAIEGITRMVRNE
jgi:hypothetical protein